MEHFLELRRISARGRSLRCSPKSGPTVGGFGVLLVDPTIPARLYLTAGANGLHRSNDSGATWTRVKTGFVGDVAMHPSSPATLYAGVDSDGVYRTTSGGAAGDN